MTLAAMRDEQARRILRQVIEGHREEIERRWLERVQHDVVCSRGIELTRLRDGMPSYIAELAHVLANEPGAFADRAQSAWSRVAQEHGITRVRIGFDISQLVHEFVVLRRVIQEIGRESDPAFPETESLLAGLLEPAVAVAVKAYVDARDYESRRTEAAHIGFLTHELRSPLTTAKLASERLRRTASEEQVPALDRLDRALSALGALVEGVLLTEKLEAGAVPPQPAEITLGQLLEPVDALRRPAREKGLAFRVNYDPDRVVRLDPTLTASAIRNLAENAVKYTDAGEVEVTVTVDDDELAVDVRDTCAGISSEELETLFEPFKRGHTDQTGTGLGLAIARRGIEAQGGTIHAESPGTSGCHFWIRLPLGPMPRT
jgi:signal transduction histidine kinase